MFQGSMVAIVTPFKADGSFDEEAYRQLIEFQIESGTDVIVPCGTTGESATLDFKEHDYVIKTCIDQVKKRVQVIAGTGANNTAEAIHLSLNAKQMGADGLLLVCPYYNKPSQEGIYQHYQRLAEEVALPQVLYNVPGRTGVNMLSDTTARLAEFIHEWDRAARLYDEAFNHMRRARGLSDKARQLRDLAASAYEMGQEASD